MAEASLDLTLGLWARRHAMVDAQAQQCALELAARLNLRLGARRAKKRERIGVNGGGDPMLLTGGPEVAEVVPGRVRGDKAARHQLAGVIVLGEDQRLFLPPAPPLVNGAVVLPEFADLRALPASPRARAGLAT